MPTCAPNPEMVKLFLDLAKTYHDHATGLFNTFITVLFSSFAFASGFPMTNFGESKKILNTTISLPSLAVAISLFSFYVISFFSFDQSVKNATAAVKEVLNQYSGCSEYNALKNVFHFENGNFLMLQLPSLGFIIGSTIGLAVFLWLANSSRKKVTAPKS